jgi:hypothetical protein
LCEPFKSTSFELKILPDAKNSYILLVQNFQKFLSSFGCPTILKQKEVSEKQQAVFSFRKRVTCSLLPRGSQRPGSEVDNVLAVHRRPGHLGHPLDLYKPS